LLVCLSIKPFGTALNDTSLTHHLWLIPWPAVCV